MFDVLEKITSLREERGWTTYKLSKLSGIPQSTISTWYRKNLMPPIDKLEIILQKMEEQNNRLERIYGKHLKLIVCTGKRSEKVKFKHKD